MIPNQLFFLNSFLFFPPTVKTHLPPAAMPGTSQWDQCVMCKQRVERLKIKTGKKEKKH